MHRARYGSKRRGIAPSVPQIAATQLAALERACEEIAHCDSLSSVRDVRDRAEAFRQYARNAKAGLELLNKAAEFKLRAERRAGQLLAEMALRGGDRVSTARDARATLEQLSISHNQSARWQKAAKVPEEHFCRFLAAARKREIEISSAALLRLASRLTKKPASFDERMTASEKHRAAESCRAHSSLKDIISELLSHCRTVDGILFTIYDSVGPVDLPSADRRYLKRLLRELRSLVEDLKTHTTSHVDR